LVFIKARSRIYFCLAGVGRCRGSPARRALPLWFVPFAANILSVFQKPVKWFHKILKKFFRPVDLRGKMHYTETHETDHFPLGCGPCLPPDEPFWMLYER